MAVEMLLALAHIWQAVTKVITRHKTTHCYQDAKLYSFVELGHLFLSIVM